MTREQLKKETLEEIEYIKTSNGLTKKDSEAMADLIARQDAYIDSLEGKGWQDISSAPYDIPILGFCLQIPDADQLKGINEGWLHLPSLPFVCKRLPENDDYEESFMTVSMYNLPEDEDCARPTHWMPLPEFPKQGQ